MQKLKIAHICINAKFLIKKHKALIYLSMQLQAMVQIVLLFSYIYNKILLLAITQQKFKLNATKTLPYTVSHWLVP